jgi:phosphoribosylaminoimidazole-succinocarboxamide synthase
VIIPAIFSNTPKLQADVRRAARSLAADVVNIKFEIGFDVMGFASIFFNIVLTDEASRPDRLRFVAQHVALTLINQLKTDENGVHAYFNFRSQSEVARIKDLAWA